MTPAATATMRFPAACRGGGRPWSTVNASNSQAQRLWRKIVSPIPNCRTRCVSLSGPCMTWFVQLKLQHFAQRREARSSHKLVPARQPSSPRTVRMFAARLIAIADSAIRAPVQFHIHRCVQCICFCSAGSSSPRDEQCARQPVRRAAVTCYPIPPDPAVSQPGGNTDTTVPDQRSLVTLILPPGS